MTVSTRIYVHRYYVSHFAIAFDSRLYAYEHRVKSAGNSLMPMEILHFYNIFYIIVTDILGMVENLTFESELEIMYSDRPW